MNAPESPDTATLQAESKPLLVPPNFKITTADQYQNAGTQLTGIKGLLQKIGLTFDPHIKRAHDAHKALVAEKRTHEQPLLNAESLLKRALLAYNAEQDRIRREQETKAREAAEKERRRIEDRAAKQAEKGNEQRAEALREKAALVSTPVIETHTPKVAGLSTREMWDFEIQDETLIPREYLVVSEQRIGAVVRAMKSATNIPGVRVFPRQTIASRAGS